MNADSESGKWMGTDLLGCSCHPTQGFSELISPVLSPQGYWSPYPPCLPPATLLCMREETQNSSKFISNLPQRTRQMGRSRQWLHLLPLSTQILILVVRISGFWGLFPKCSQVISSWYVFSSQLDLKECEDKSSFLFLYSAFLCLSFSPILHHHHTSRKPQAWAYASYIMLTDEWTRTQERSQPWQRELLLSEEAVTGPSKW